MRVIKIVCLLLLVSVASASADAAQPGRITAEVNFREGPSRSAPIIGRLKAGAQVQVIKRNPAGWYFVMHQQRPGFIHVRYVKLEEENPNPIKQFVIAERHFLIPAGLILGVALALWILRKVHP